MKFAVRQLLKNPGFTTVIVVILALGMGATTAIFSVVNAVLLNPLPFPQSHQLVRIHETIPKRNVDRIPVAVPSFLDWSSQSASFSGMAAHQWAEMNLTGPGDPRRLRGIRATSGIFSVLGVEPVLGRVFSAGEEPRGQHFVTLISHAFWQREFGGDTAVLGRTLILDGDPFTVIGVLPQGLRYPARDLDIWIPAAFQPGELQQRDNLSWGVVARLKEGVGLGQASAEMTTISARLAAQFVEKREFSASVVRLQDEIVGESRTPLLVLLGAVGCLLAIACANVANLMLARASARQREFAIRSALGASRGALIRQALTESLVLAAAGGIAGVLIASVAVQLLRTLAGSHLPRADEIHLSLPVFAFALLTTIGTGLLFGLAPAIRASASEAEGALKEGGRSGSDGLGRNRYRSTLVIAEVALSMVLLAGAGLFLRSFVKLQNVDPGFRAEGITTADLLLPEKVYPTEQRQAAVFTEVVARLEATPGVQQAAAVFGLPRGPMRSRVTFKVEGQEAEMGSMATDAAFRQVTPGYFATLGIPLHRGRDFDARDGTNAPGVVVVNQTFIRRFFPGSRNEPLPTARINVDGGPNTWLQIVGVVGDVRSEENGKAPDAEIFLPFTQKCWGFASIVVRASREAGDLSGAMRSVVASVDPKLPLASVVPLRTLVDNTLAERRLQAVLLGVFAVLALVLAGTGIYGVMAYSVSCRVQEIGIRMALGARVADVLAMVVRQGLVLALAGLALGLVGGFLVARMIRGLLFEIAPHDPATFGGVTLLLLLVALAACWIPARRAARVDPMAALRGE